MSGWRREAPTVDDVQRCSWWWVSSRKREVPARVRQLCVCNGIVIDDDGDPLHGPRWDLSLVEWAPCEEPRRLEPEGELCHSEVLIAKAPPPERQAEAFAAIREAHQQQPVLVDSEPQAGSRELTARYPDDTAALSLLAAGRQHDAAMTRSPWTVEPCEHGFHVAAGDRLVADSYGAANDAANAAGIAFWGTHRRVLLALAEEALRGRQNSAELEREVELWRDDIAERDASIDKLMAERDEARRLQHKAEVERDATRRQAADAEREARHLRIENAELLGNAERADAQNRRQLMALILCVERLSDGQERYADLWIDIREELRVMERSLHLLAQALFPKEVAAGNKLYDAAVAAADKGNYTAAMEAARPRRNERTCHWSRSEGTSRRSDQPETPKQRWAKVLLVSTPPLGQRPSCITTACGCAITNPDIT